MNVTVNGISLFFTEMGQGDTAFLWIHNSGGDHRLFLPQLPYFSQFGRVIVPDLRGHGKSSKPVSGYSIETFSDDLMHLCKHLSIRHIIAAGSSMGGNIAVDMACRYPNLVNAAILVDSAIFLTAKIQKAIEKYRAGMAKGTSLEEIIEASVLPTDRSRDWIKNASQVVPVYVWEEVFEQLLKWDRKSKERIASCKAPLLYIESSAPGSDHSDLCDFKEFYAACSDLMTGKVVGAGHFPSLDAPDQINSMVHQFLKVKGLL